MSIRRFISPVLAVLLLAGLGAACGTPPTEPVEIYSRLETAGMPEQQQATYPVEFRIEAPVEVERGNSVPFRLVLSNVGDEPAEFSWGSDEFDIVVTRPDGTVVWERLYGLDFSTMLVVAILQPGESLEWEADWRQRDTRRRAVATGEYSVRGILLGNIDGREGWLWTPDAPVRIVP